METISASPKQCLSVVRSVPKCLFIVTFVKKTNNLSKKSSAGEERSPKSRCLAEFQEGNHSRFNTSPVIQQFAPSFIQQQPSTRLLPPLGASIIGAADGFFHTRPVRPGPCRYGLAFGGKSLSASLNHALNDPR